MASRSRAHAPSSLAMKETRRVDDRGGSRPNGTRFPHEAPERACPVQRLPGDAEAIAGAFARNLRVPQLHAPLAAFLRDSVSAPWLAAAGLAIWRRPRAVPRLEVYALLDDRTWPHDGAAPTETYRAVIHVFAALDREVRTNGLPLGCTLSWINTRGEDLCDLVRTLPKELAAKDPILGVSPKSERMSLFTVAQTTESG